MIHLSKNVLCSAFLVFFSLSKSVYAQSLNSFVEDLDVSDFESLGEPIISNEEKARRDKEAIRACDRLAAHPWDYNAHANGVKWKNLNGEKAVAACSKAHNADGRNPRIRFQLGRAYDKLGDKRALHFIKEASSEYPAASFHYATFLEAGLYVEKDFKRAVSLYTDAAALGHVPSIFAVGRLRYYHGGSDAERNRALQEIRFAAEKDYPSALELLDKLKREGKI